MLVVHTTLNENSRAGSEEDLKIDDEGFKSPKFIEINEFGWEYFLKDFEKEDSIHR